MKLAMSRERYPLEAALTLRAEEEAARRLELTQTLRRREHAAEMLRIAERAAREHLEDTERIAGEELTRDRSGRSIDEMLRAQSFLDRRRHEQRTHEAAIERARDAERDAERAEIEARAALTTAIAEREAIERHRAAWAELRRKDAEKKEDEESEEHAARRG